MRKLYFLDRYGYPVELIKGRWITNIIRRVLWTRRITTRRPACLDPQPSSSTCTTPGPETGASS